jgi:hypothetical protein
MLLLRDDEIPVVAFEGGEDGLEPAAAVPNVVPVALPPRLIIDDEPP